MKTNVKSPKSRKKIKDENDETMNDDFKNMMITQIPSTRRNTQIPSPLKKTENTFKFLPSDLTLKIMIEEILESLRKEKKARRKKVN